MVLPERINIIQDRDYRAALNILNLAYVWQELPEFMPDVRKPILYVSSSNIMERLLNEPGNPLRD